MPVIRALLLLVILPCGRRSPRGIRRRGLITRVIGVFSLGRRPFIQRKFVL